MRLVIDVEHAACRDILDSLLGQQVVEDTTFPVRCQGVECRQFASTVAKTTAGGSPAVENPIA